LTTPDHASPAATKLVAGELCLDFANTADWHASAQPQETLTRYEALVSWAGRAGVLDASTARRLLREAAEHPIAASAALHRAITVREAIYRIAVGLLERQRPHPADLETLNRALASALPHRLVARGHDGFAWSWEPGSRALDQMLWPILWSAADLLTSEKRHRIGQCADDRGCGWLFLDTTKNHSRRWCDMEDCGNRAKAQRHYRRSRGRRPGDRT
jgi:predicted RNA-binding Zn ribbon-like protein